LPAKTLAAVKQAWADHSVVWFPGQPLGHDELEAFTLQFGAFGHDPYIKPLEERPHILEVRREPDETTSVFGAAWHSDWSFQDAPPAATLLHAKVIPPVGGDTLYADCYRAFEALSPAMQDILTSLHGVHSAARPYGPQGAYAKEEVGRSMTILWSAEAEKTHSHPIVRTHPVSGRRALFVNPVYTVGIEGMTEAESAALLGFLFKHMTQDEFVYRHAWSTDMLTMWDNRCALHNATGGYDGHLRVLHRTTVAGEMPE
jgi:taurine dioxygenase